jgi:hypothetical protein
VVLLAAAFLLVQDYLVYDSNGKMRLDLPFFEKETQEQEVPLNNDEVTIDILTPEDVEDPRLPVKELHGRMMAARVLERDVEKTVAATLEDDIVIEVKRVNGFITYHSAAAIPEEVDVARGETMENFKAVLEGEKYVVARMSTLCDSYFVRAYREAALGRENGGYWYDGDNRTWLDPAHPQTLVYITSLCQELTEMGVDELMLDYFSYPTSGNLAAMVVIDAVTRLLPGALGCDESGEDESFSEGLLEYPQYTRPVEFRGLRVPEVLQSGDHNAIQKWRRRKSEELTRRLRPDLYGKAVFARLRDIPMKEWKKTTKKFLIQKEKLKNGNSQEGFSGIPEE